MNNPPFPCQTTHSNQSTRKLCKYSYQIVNFLCPAALWCRSQIPALFQASVILAHAFRFENLTLSPTSAYHISKRKVEKSVCRILLLKRTATAFLWQWLMFPGSILRESVIIWKKLFRQERSSRSLTNRLQEGDAANNEGLFFK